MARLDAPEPFWKVAGAIPSVARVVHISVIVAVVAVGRGRAEDF